MQTVSKAEFWQEPGTGATGNRKRCTHPPVCSVASGMSTLCDCRDCSLPGSSIHGDSPKDPGMGCRALLQGIFVTQGWACVSYVSSWWQVGSLPLVPSGKLILILMTFYLSSYYLMHQVCFLTRSYKAC